MAWDDESAVCPGGHQSFEWWEQKHHRNGTPVIKVFFSAEHCRLCPKQPSCTKPPSGRRGRGVTFLPRERHEALEAARRAQTPTSGRTATRPEPASKAPSPKPSASPESATPATATCPQPASATSSPPPRSTSSASIDG
ncbi:transposase [Streptomyces sp. NPDC002917]|uniref:transposase n=1 Tax=unclassified Streptomyces TaxID=2593676 RepID=UPI003697F10E